MLPDGAPLFPASNCNAASASEISVQDACRVRLLYVRLAECSPSSALHVIPPLSFARSHPRIFRLRAHTLDTAMHAHAHAYAKVGRAPRTRVTRQCRRCERIDLARMRWCDKCQCRARNGPHWQNCARRCEGATAVRYLVNCNVRRILNNKSLRLRPDGPHAASIPFEGTRARTRVQGCLECGGAPLPCRPACPRPHLSLSLSRSRSGPRPRHRSIVIGSRSMPWPH